MRNEAADARRGIPDRGEHCEAAERAAADFEGHPEAAKFSEPGRLRSWGSMRKKTPAGRGARLGSWYAQQTRAPGAGGEKASGSYESAPGAFPNLYKVAHAEMTVDKSNNSASGA